MNANLHREINFEDEICQYLGGHGWLYAEGDGILVHYNAFPNSTPADRLRLAKVQKAFACQQGRHHWCTDTKNVWIVAATFVHEFAHIGGAPGWPSPAAEKALPKCGFGPQYDPGIRGSIESVARTLAGMA